VIDNRPNDVVKACTMCLMTVVHGIVCQHVTTLIPVGVAGWWSTDHGGTFKGIYWEAASQNYSKEWSG